MKFLAESQLVETLKTCLKSSFNRSYIQISEEVSVGYGIADLVVTELKPNYPLRTDIKELLEINDINILSVIKNAKCISLENITELTRCSKRSIKISIQKLVNSGYILASESGFLIKDDYELNFVQNYAIEAKLKDWKRALKQAYRYKWFAEYAFVVLDAYYSKPALENLIVFEKYNVGLASMTVDGKLQRHFSPKKEMPLDENMQVLLSEKLNYHKLAK